MFFYNCVLLFLCYKVYINPYYYNYVCVNLNQALHIIGKNNSVILFMTAFIKYYYSNSANN